MISHVVRTSRAADKESEKNVSEKFVLLSYIDYARRGQ